jgi:hypothetical protein
VHQDQYVVEKEQDTREVEKVCLKVESTSPEKNIPEEKSENIATKNYNSTSYVRESNTGKRWYILPVVVMVFLWILSKLLKRKK